MEAAATVLLLLLLLPPSSVRSPSFFPLPSSVGVSPSGSPAAEEERKMTLDLAKRFFPRSKWGFNLRKWKGERWERAFLFVGRLDWIFFICTPISVLFLYPHTLLSQLNRIQTVPPPPKKCWYRLSHYALCNTAFNDSPSKSELRAAMCSAARAVLPFSPFPLRS